MIELLLSVIAIIISGISIIFVGLRVGMAFTLGFREAEATANRRKEICSSLKREVEQAFGIFLEEHRDETK